MRHQEYIIQTADWKVREFRVSDASDLRRGFNDRQIARLIGSSTFPYTAQHAQQWIRLCQRRYKQSSNEHQHFAITIDDSVVGGIGADRDGDQADFGYWLARPYWGQGIMTGVVQRFVPYLFRTWPVTRVVAKTFLDNLGSMRVLEKSGFKEMAQESSVVKNSKKRIVSRVYLRYRK